MSHNAWGSFEEKLLPDRNWTIFSGIQIFLIFVVVLELNAHLDLTFRSILWNTKDIIMSFPSGRRRRKGPCSQRNERSKNSHIQRKRHSTKGDLNVALDILKMLLEEEKVRFNGLEVRYLLWALLSIARDPGFESRLDPFLPMLIQKLKNVRSVHQYKFKDPIRAFYFIFGCRKKDLYTRHSPLSIREVNAQTRDVTPQNTAQFYQMSLAANDAFSLGLAHNGPRRRSLSRSSSPKISTAALFSQSTQGKGRENIRRRMIRRLSNLSSIPPEATAELQDHNGDLKAPSRKDVKPPLSSSPKKRPTPVDWEIPRKTLHSSIGMSLLFFALFLPLTEAFMPGFLTIYLYVSHQSPRHVVFVLCAALAFLIPADLLRFRFSRFARIYEKFFGFLMRDSEKVRSIPSFNLVPLITF
jgi:hypothetical protein